MARPQQFACVANCTFAVLLALYLLISTLGYAAFGAGVASPVLCNLPRDVSTPMGLAATMTKLVIALHVITAVRRNRNDELRHTRPPIRTAARRAQASGDPHIHLTSPRPCRRCR